jgi:hypothetical protein
VFLSDDGRRIAAVVVYSNDEVKHLRFPVSARARIEEDTLPGSAPTVPGTDPTPRYLRMAPRRLAR